MERSRKNPVAAVAAVLLTGGLVLLVRRRRRSRVAAGRGRFDDGGGLAGVREPRRPLPKDLVGAAAAEPGE